LGHEGTDDLQTFNCAQFSISFGENFLLLFGCPIMQNAGAARAYVGRGDAASVQDRPTVQRGRGARPALRQEGGARRAPTASIKFDGPGIGTLKLEGHILMFTIVSLRTKGAHPVTLREMGAHLVTFKFDQPSRGFDGPGIGTLIFFMGHRMLSVLFKNEGVHIL
jgi:hypothetical protein